MKGLENNKKGSTRTFNRVKRSLSNEEKERKFERAIDRNYKRIFGEIKDEWKDKFKKADLLTNIVEKDTKDGVYCRIKEVVRFNNFQ
jgi:hypothetical protein